MALGLPESLWRGAERQSVPKGSRKAVDKMVRLNIPLDPAKTGRDALSLETNLRRWIVGQDEAIEQIVGTYRAVTGNPATKSMIDAGRRKIDGSSNSICFPCTRAWVMLVA